MPDISSHAQGARYQYAEQKGCLWGTHKTTLEAIKSWANDFGRSPIFWLNGLAGTGKSTIAQSIMEWCDVQGQLGSSFFHSHDINNHSSHHLIFPTLAVQLAHQHPKVRSILLPLLQSNPDIVYESPSDQVEKLIVKPLKSADVPAIIVIDALDEWTDDTSQFTTLSAIEYWVREIPKVKFLITSRPKPHILASFQLPLLSGLADVFTLQGIMPDLINNDIRIFLKHELSGLAARNGLDSWLTGTQLDLLCGRAAGLFVYAVATVKFLGHKNTSPDEQYAIILHSPDDTVHEGTVEGVHRGMSLDSLCTSIFQTSFRNNDAEDDAVVRSVFANMILVTRPLPPSAIADLICLEVGDVMSILGSVQPLLRLQEDPEQPVYPFHKLLSDFLTSPTRCVDERFYIAPGKFHSKIALSCLRLMNETLVDSLLPQHHTVNSEAALEYACGSWHIHLAESREDIFAIIPALRQFLEEKILVWLEKFSGPGAAPDPVFALNKTISWLREVRLGLLTTSADTHMLQTRLPKTKNSSTSPSNVWLP